MSQTDEMTETRALDRDEVVAALTGPGQSHELERIVVAGTPVRAFKNAPRSLRELFADTRGDAEFIV